MFTKLSNTTQALLFYLLAVGLSTLVALLTVALDKPNAVGFVMFTPLLALLLMLCVITREGYSKASWQALGLQRMGWRGWPMALWLPLVLLASSYTISCLLGVADWQWPRDIGIGAYAAGLVASLLIGTLFALGEEIGWRGYLLPKLLGLGRVRAVVVVGLLHGVWHLPMILLTPFYHGNGNPLIVVPLFLLTLTVGGVFYGYLRLSTNSLWPVALAHGAFNTIWSALTALTVPTSALWMEYLSGESGVITLILAMIAVSFLLHRLATPETPIYVGEKLVHLETA